MTKYRVACLQMHSGTDIARNVENFEALTRQAAAKGARYIQSPEMTGIVQRDRRQLFASIFEDADDPLFARAAELAKELGVAIHVGSTAIRLGTDSAANRAALFGPTGARLASYDKIHMFDVEIGNGERWCESKVYQPGNQAVAVDLSVFILGVGICYDVRFPGLYANLAKAGATVLSAPSAFTRPTGESHWEILLRARAIENGAYMVAAAQGGQHQDGRVTYGHSMIVDPWGKVVAGLGDAKEGVLMADINLAFASECRAKIPSLDHQRGFTIDTITAPQRARVGA